MIFTTRERKRRRSIKDMLTQICCIGKREGDLTKKSKKPKKAKTTPLDALQSPTKKGIRCPPYEFRPVPKHLADLYLLDITKKSIMACERRSHGSTPHLSACEEHETSAAPTRDPS